MNPANASNATASATTSAANPTARHDSHSVKLTEAQYLEQQQSAAKAAIADAFGELKRDLARGADPRVWMKTHPWITLASAAVAGFAATAAAVPSKEQQALNKLEAMERALNAAKHPASHGNGDHKKQGGLLGTLIHELVGAIKPVVMTLLSTHLNPPHGTEDPIDGAGQTSNEQR